MAPVCSPVKQSYADRPDSPENIPAEGKYLLPIGDVEKSIYQCVTMCSIVVLMCRKQNFDINHMGPVHH